MFVFVAALIFSSAILGAGFMYRNVNSNQCETVNEELNKFYEMFTETPNIQLRQLVLAAKTLLKNVETNSKDKESILNLYNERILSDKYYKRIRGIEEDLFVEKTLIENEAEAIKIGAKDSVFMEANKLLGTGSSSIQKLKLFDEAAFLKRQDSLRQGIKSNDK